MTPEFKKAIGFTLWGIVIVLFIVEKLLQRRLHAYVRERYPDKAKVPWWRGFGKLSKESKTDLALKQYYRQLMGLTWLEGIVVASAAVLSGWHFWFF